MSPVPVWAERPLGEEEAIAPKTTKKARLQFTNAHRDKNLQFWNYVRWSDETKVEPWDIVLLDWKNNGEAYKPENIIPTVKHSVGSVMMCGQNISQNRWPHDEGTFSQLGS